MPKMINLASFWKTWSLWTISVTRQVTFDRIKIDGKKMKMRHFVRFFKHCDTGFQTSFQHEICQKIWKSHEKNPQKFVYILANLCRFFFQFDKFFLSFFVTLRYVRFLVKASNLKLVQTTFIMTWKFKGDFLNNFQDCIVYFLGLLSIKND